MENKIQLTDAIKELTAQLQSVREELIIANTPAHERTAQRQHWRNIDALTASETKREVVLTRLAQLAEEHNEGCETYTESFTSIPEVSILVNKLELMNQLDESLELAIEKGFEKGFVERDGS